MKCDSGGFEKVAARHESGEGGGGGGGVGGHGRRQ